MVYQFLARLAAFFLPRHCLLCGTDNTPQTLCRACLQSLPWIENACPTCGEVLPAAAKGNLCGICLKSPPPVDRFVCALNYQFPVRELMLQLKYAAEFMVLESLRPVSQSVFMAVQPLSSIMDSWKNQPCSRVLLCLFSQCLVCYQSVSFISPLR